MNSSTDNVVFFEEHKSRNRRTPQDAGDSRVFSEPTDGDPVNACGFTEKTSKASASAVGGIAIGRYQRLMDDLTDHFNGDLSGQKLQARWPSEYQSWKAMRYERTGPQGQYTRDPRFDKFPDFLSMVGAKPSPEYTLDRIDPSNPHYGPDLVKWAPKAEQTHNRRNTRMLTDSQGNCLSVAEWSRKTGIKQNTIRERLRAGKSVDEAVYTSVGGFETASPKSRDGDGTARLVTLWRTILADEHEQRFFSPDGKEIGQLGQIADRLIDGKVSPDKAVEYILANWRDFTHFAELHYGAWQKRPRIPTVTYLHANVQAAGNFYLNREDSAPKTYKAPGLFKRPGT